MKSGWLKIFFGTLISLSLVVAGCGGGSSGGAADVGGNNVIEGIASKGVIADAMVIAYAINADGTIGAELGNSTTDASGYYQIEVGAYGDSALVEAQGGFYTDEATLAIIGNNRLRAMIPEVKENIEVAVTPLTEVAVQLAGNSYTVSQINNANAAVAVLMGGADITATQPLDINSDLSGATAAEKDYVMLLATISQMVEDGSAADVDEAITLIKADLQDDGALAHDGTGAGDLLQIALGNFVISTENITGLTEEDITLDEAIAEVPVGPFFFAGTDGVTGGELWASDGTEAGTYMVKDIKAGAGESLPDYFVDFAGKTYFFADDGVNGREIWVTDGTEAGTLMAIEVDKSTLTSYPRLLREFQGKLYFSANDGASGQVMWVSDGTDAGTQKMLDSEGAPIPSPWYMTQMGDKMFFKSTGLLGSELWFTDGTEAGTHILKDIVVGGDSSLIII